MFKADVWNFIGKVDAICVTTNGFIKNNGCCVMGRGIALQARDRYKGIDRKIGSLIKINGNVPAIAWKDKGTNIVTFPVKTVSEVMTKDTLLVKHMMGKFAMGDLVPGYALKADLSIIEKSSMFLSELIDQYDWKTVMLPMPGCHNGQLTWEIVEPIVSKYLKDKVVIITNERFKKL